MLAGCGEPAPPLCARPDATLADGLACAEAEAAVGYAEVLAARALTSAQRQRLLGDLKARAADDPAAVHAALAAAAAFAREVATLPPIAQAERRSAAVVAVGRGEGPLPAARFPDAAGAVQDAIAVWETDAAEGLALTEMDIEGWLRYASLCREVQGGGTLKLSVADRFAAYKVVRDRFRALDREGRLAFVAVGPFWPDVRDRWAAASYDEQQAWIRAAPLPPPMTAASVGYVTAVTGGDVAAHVRALHAHLGPLRMGVIR